MAKAVTKQQLSVILRSQLICDFKDSYNHADSSMATNLVASGYHRNNSITWYSEKFSFSFEYSRSGAVRVTYLNSDGLQSAVFNAAEWRLLMHDIQNKCREYDAKRKEAIKQARREREKMEFDAAVEAAVYKVLERERKRDNCIKHAK